MQHLAGLHHFLLHSTFFKSSYLESMNVKGNIDNDKRLSICVTALQ